MRSCVSAAASLAVPLPPVSHGGYPASHPPVWFDRDMAEDVRAEIVASVLEVVVSKGDQIGPGDTVVLLESMKMEIPVLAEIGGTISEVNVAVGDVIQAGHLIAVIDD